MIHRVIPHLQRLSTRSIPRTTASSTPCRLVIRTMASSTSSTPAKTQWLVILPDHAGALEKRMSVRPAHLQNLTPRIDAGFWSLGGALLNEPAQEGKALDIKGSAMLANAATKEEVIEELKKDIYSTGGVWNWDEVVIYPFKAAFIKGQ